jgi:hypothetical protein
VVTVPVTTESAEQLVRLSPGQLVWVVYRGGVPVGAQVTDPGEGSAERVAAPDRPRD